MSKDLFSKQAGDYAKFRPVYPPQLFEHILRFVEHTGTAWDCATGNGQAAVALAARFQKVYATDISQKQIELAAALANIEYSLAAAENSGFSENMFDCITVAQAYHWLRADEFEKEVRRVARKNAVIAVWGYGLFSTQDDSINELIQKFYRETVGPYWDKERKFIDENYQTILFPYTPLPSGDFSIKTIWGPQEATGYLRSWSSVQHFIDANKYDPVQMIADELDSLWKTEREVSFPLFLRLGKI